MLELAFRGRSRHRLKEFLVGLGGKEHLPDLVGGRTWLCHLRERPVRIGPSLRVREVRLAFVGDEKAVYRVTADLRRQVLWRLN